ncbi:MAG: YidC/Oxa1 family membrane protein insertase [Clostridia bacterium]|nr:YidC/Oxa1 family membrane protein insertase [Clostridia bacterium]
MEIINKPLGYVLKFFADICGGNFAAAVLIFTIFINLILIPLSIKSQKSTVQQTRIKPKLDELKKRCGDDKQKYNIELQKLYQEEGVSMSGGCLPMIIRLVIMWCIYSLILSPVTYMTGANKSDVKTVGKAITESLESLKDNDSDKYSDIVDKLSLNEKSSNQREIVLVRVLRDDSDIIHDIMSEKKFSKIEKEYNAVKAKYDKADIDFNLFGLDLTDRPIFGFDFVHDWQPIWLMPIFAFLAQILTGIVSMAIQKKNNPEAPSMAGMMLTMPLISLFIGFRFQGAVCFYWICSSLVGGFIQSGIQLLYGPHKMLAKYRLKEITQQADFEQKQLQKLQ